ncbi:hypothetical protein [Luteimonas suaedae]|uniref:hypothetical protein n=1 Tax=Luteimonas suaedae TaxID=2605430 RepID=UPI0011EE5021|nr:hypothetical protein [Luteimonas suaedae]
MTAQHETKRTTDHDEIRRWVESREGWPSTVAETSAPDEDAGVLRIAFRDDPALEKISWEDFFEKFEDEELAFQERTRDGSRSRFFKFVERDAD